ncbi:MAG: hypothetical protein IPK75_12640 [Acidobacteria bacterium]|nr:hypothetical protein [Acidobacteriota bacterium]
MTSSDLWKSQPARAIELVVSEVNRSGKFSENGKAEIAVRLLYVLRNAESPLKVRCSDGDAALTKDELKALGLRGSIKMDREYWNSLSPAGQADPVDAAETIYHRALSAVSFEGTFSQARTLGLSKCRIYAGGARACDYARRHDRAMIPVPRAGEWPPAECDAPWCSCALAADPAS